MLEGEDWSGEYTMEMDGGTCNGMDAWHLNKMDAEEEKEEKRF